MENTLNKEPKPLNKKERLFVIAYTDPTSTNTYQNATQSAIKAGYSERNSASQGCKMLKKPIVAQEITAIYKEAREKYALTKEEAIIEARKNYESATAHGERKYWYDLWVDLQSWKVQKTENFTTVQEFSQDESEYYTEFVRNAMERPN